MATIAVYFFVYLIAIAIQTGILAVALFLVEDIKASSFKEFGAVGTLGRCAAIVVVATIVAFVPFFIGVVLALLVWFIGIMFLFQKTLGQTFILFLVNFVVSIGVSGAIEKVLSSLLAV